MKEIFVSFVKFEECYKEMERARCSYKNALNHLPKGQEKDLYGKFVMFGKQYGDSKGILDVLVSKVKWKPQLPTLCVA